MVMSNIHFLSRYMTENAIPTLYVESFSETLCENNIDFIIPVVLIHMNIWIKQITNST